MTQHPLMQEKNASEGAVLLQENQHARQPQEQEQNNSSIGEMHGTL
ncbi:hypothetical protein [Faecalispora jeddahensis]|nr:hypothetical protein [Faecalispora jeddahensis]